MTANAPPQAAKPAPPAIAPRPAAVDTDGAVSPELSSVSRRKVFYLVAGTVVVALLIFMPLVPCAKCQGSGELSRYQVDRMRVSTQVWGCDGCGGVCRVPLLKVLRGENAALDTRRNPVGPRPHRP